ncbi:MAG TPA: divalent metal cation transporter, partial [Acidimicrobiales bacterium]|nr:divalent metal cation transporter [Acidimicrobiales bacterium]
LAHVLGGAIVLSGLNLVNVAVDVMVMNALLLPIVLGLLLVLEARALPWAQRMHGTRRLVATGLCVLVISFGLYMVPATFGWV